MRAPGAPAAGAAKRPHDSLEHDLRDLAAASAAMTEALHGLTAQVAEARGDAREARDLARDLGTALREQNLTGRLEALKTEIHSDLQGIRLDVVNANSRLQDRINAESDARRADIEAHEARLKDLEAERNKVVGVAAFFSWMASVAPWLFGMAAAVIAWMAGTGQLRVGGR